MPNFLRGNWPLAIGGLVVLNLVLIAALLLRQPASSAQSSTAVPMSSDAPADSPAPSETARTPSATPTPEPSRASHQTPETESSIPRASKILAANSKTIGWRATASGCGERSFVDVTTDGGASWRRTDPGLRGIVRLKSYGNGSVFAIGADSKCRPTYAWIRQPDGVWQTDPSMVDKTWFRRVDEPDLVHAPGGRVFTPCGSGLADLAGLGSFSAAALCTDGRIRTLPGGNTWKTILTNSGARALNADDSGFVVAMIVDGCAGVVVQRFDADGEGLTGEPHPCHRMPAGSATALGVAIRGSATWVWSTRTQSL
jgi:hypothetical protein